MRGRVAALLCAGALVLGAGEARAAPVALLDAPEASSVALAGSEVLVARGSRGGVRIDALPVAGGPVRRVATVPPPQRRLSGGTVLAASPQRVAALVEFTDEGGFPTEVQLWTGPPAGPLRREVRVSWGARRGWVPVAIDVDADRLLVVEASVPNLRFRARVLSPGTAPVRVPWRGAMRPPAALAGNRVAFVSSLAGGKRAEMVVMDWRTGAVTSRTAGGDVVELDLAPDGRVVTQAENGSLQLPRFAGDRITALEPGRFETRRPVVLDPAGGAPVPLGMPTSSVDAFAADASGAAWIANGCVLYAPLAGPAPGEPPDGPCPRAEVAVEEGDQILRGRRIRFIATCIAAPASGCRGTVLVRGEGRRVLGRGRFEVAAGKRGRVEVVLTPRGLRHARAGLRREGAAYFGVRVRTPGGRHAGDGASGAVVDRLAGEPPGRP